MLKVLKELKNNCLLLKIYSKIIGKKYNLKKCISIGYGIEIEKIIEKELLLDITEKSVSDYRKNIHKEIDERMDYFIKTVKGKEVQDLEIKMMKSVRLNLQIEKELIHRIKILKKIGFPGGVSVRNLIHMWIRNQFEYENHFIFLQTDNYFSDIRKRKFADCISISLDDDILEISENCFKGYEYLKYIRLPKNLKEIKEDTFSWCCSLRKIEFPNKLKYIGERAFVFSGLMEVNFPFSLEKIEDGSFAYCKYLKKITFSRILGESWAKAFLDTVE